MKNQILRLASLSACLTASLPAAELVPSQIPSSSKWVLHLDLDAMRESETGKAIFSRIEAEHGAKLQALKRISSVHLINDLHDISLFGDGQPEHGVALIRGNFDQAHMVDVAKASDAYTEEAYGGFTIRSWKDKEKTQNAAFANDGLLVFSRQNDALKQELDLLKANAPATADPIFSTSGGKPLIAATAKLGEIQLPPDASKILRLASTIRVSAVESNGRFAIHAGAETTDTKHANRLRRMLDGILALAEAGNAALGEVDLQSEVATTPNQPGVNVALSVPVPAWLGIMKEAADRKMKDGH